MLFCVCLNALDFNSYASSLVPGTFNILQDETDLLSVRRLSLRSLDPEVAGSFPVGNFMK